MEMHGCDVRVEGWNPFSMTDDNFRVCIVDIHDFVNMAVERVWLWFKISRSLLRLDQVEV